MKIQPFMKVADGINVMPLRMSLVRQPELFGKYDLRATAYKSPHTDMKDIWVRFNDIKNYNPENPASFIEEHDSVWYPVIQHIPEVRDIVFPLMAHVKGERLGGVLITKLPPGGQIAKHVDSGWHAEYYDKYYVPIQNDDGAIFAFEDGVIEPRLGEAYWFNNSVPHWVENNSQQDRIAMIVCIRSHRSKE